MGTYEMLGRKIEFPDSAERFFDMQHRAWNAMSNASNEFEKWYKKCGDILTVLKGYENEATSLVIKYANRPLFSELIKLEIYDISEDKYDEQCLDFTELSSALDVIADKYNAIIAEQEAAEEYRAERKASRGRVVGGGFGVGGAVKGMATAGAMNAISGAGHGIVNALGNAGSALAASSSKKALYENNATIQLLKEGIKDDILSCFNLHMHLVNERKNSYIVSPFDSDKAGAIFESAKKVISKQKELLIESFENCPWNEELLSFVFLNYKAERKNIWNISLRFHINLHNVAEKAFAASYTLEAKESEDIAKEVKKDILSQMKDFGISSSETINHIEIDGLNRIAKSYDVFCNEKTKQAIFNDIDEYDAAQKNKAKVIHDKGIWELANKYSVKFSKDEVENILGKIYNKRAKASEDEALKSKAKIMEVMRTLNIRESSTFDSLEKDCIQRLCPNYESADEKTCNEMLSKINSYSALQKNKKPFVDGINSRIESIWTKEDSKVFDKLYMNTDIHNPNEIQKAVEEIKKKGRTANSKKYISALSGCTEQNIQKALKFQNKSTKICMYAGFIFIALGIILLIAKLGIILALAVAIIGIVLLSYYFSLKNIWDLLTLNGELIHRMLTIPSSEQKVNTTTAETQNKAEKINNEIVSTKSEINKDE